MNVSSNHTPKHPFHRSHVTIIAQVMSLGVLGGIIVLGNLASIVTFAKTKSLRKKSSYLIINLSIADLLVGIVVFTSLRIFLTGTQFNTYVIMLEFLDIMTGMASILIMSSIAVDRLFAISNPFRHRMLRYKSYMAICAFPWLISISSCSVYLVAFLSVPPFPHLYQVYSALYSIILALALIIIIFSYIAIWIKSHQAKPNDHNYNRASRDRKLAVTLFIVTLASLLTWLPFQCFENVLLICEECGVLDFNILFIMKFLQFSNSSLNFFIYMLRMREFRSAFWSIFKCSKKPKRSDLAASAFSNTINMTTLGENQSIDAKPIGEMNLGFSYRQSYSVSKSFKNAIHRPANKEAEGSRLNKISATDVENKL